MGYFTLPSAWDKHCGAGHRGLHTCRVRCRHTKRLPSPPGINPGFDVEEAKSELERARQELIEALKSNPLTRNLQAIGQSTEVGNVLVAVSQLDGFFVKTYFTVETSGDRIVITPTMMKG